MAPSISHFKQCITASFFIVFLMILCPSKSQALTVDQIRLGVHPDRTRLVMDLSEAAAFRVFLLPGPYRMVIDLPALEWRAGTLGRKGGTGVVGLRQGRLAEGLSRVVFDLDRPVAIRGAFVLPRNGTAPDRLVVDFTPVPDSAFLKEKDRIHGTMARDPATERSLPSALRTAAREASVPVETLLAPAAGAIVRPPALPARKPGSLGSPPAASGSSPLAPPVAAPPVIVIDPGHGGMDPGAIGANGVHEKNVTLAIARELRDQLVRTGRYRVRMTRDSDIYLRLPERVAVARRESADLFISIHADSTDKRGVRGASVYTLSEKASDAQTAKLAERENRVDLIAGVDLSHEDAQVANILVDLA
ncbi:MAG TPA: N-acetylmuramoyl-L-alanine amidase, partial [Alphaproteobacteria bacterium]|nr:N-acetylmuramoyl-L-alanine amidase [Alphaproteobacteria bacterium]